MKQVSLKALAVVLFCLPICANQSVKAAESDQKLLEAVGGLSAAYVYQTYLNIGMIGDGVANKTMEAASGKQILGSVVNLVEVIDKQLGALQDGDKLSDDDKRGIAEFRSIISLLRIEGKELQAMMDTGDKSHAAKFDEARKAAWEKIKALMGLKD